MDVHMGHVHPAPGVQDGHPVVAAALAGPAVQLLNDGHQLGRHRPDVVQRPLFQRLGQNGVVGVGAGLFHLGQGLVEGQAQTGQQPDQFGNHHGGVGVVDLDGHMVAEGLGPEAPAGQFFQNQLGPRRHHEVLLIHPQQLALVVAVVGVEEGGQAVGDVPLVKPDAVGRGLGGVGHVKQMEPVGNAAVGAGHQNVVEVGRQLKAPEGNGEGLAGGNQPALGLNPGVGLFLLSAVGELLVEQAVVIVQAHAIPGQAQGRNGIQKTGGQTAQSAIAQRGLRLVFLQSRQGAAHFVEKGADRLEQAQGQKVIAEQLAQQKFGREVVELAPGVGGRQGGGPLLGQGQQGLIELGVGAVRRRTAKALLGDGGQLLFEFHGKPLLFCDKTEYGSTKQVRLTGCAARGRPPRGAGPHPGARPGWPAAGCSPGRPRAGQRRPPGR